MPGDTLDWYDEFYGEITALDPLRDYNTFALWLCPFCEDESCNAAFSDGLGCVNRGRAGVGPYPSCILEDVTVDAPIGVVTFFIGIPRT